MLPPARLGEHFLPLSFGIARALFVRPLIPAAMAANAFLIVFVPHVLCIQRATAGAAECMVAEPETVAHAHALVEDEALAMPQAFLFGHMFEVIQNAALEVVHLLHTLGAGESGRLLAVDAAGAEHGDLGRATLRLDLGALGTEPLGNSRKLLVSGSIAPLKVPICTS